MIMRNKTKVSIIGAGFVGSTTAYAILMDKLSDEIVLVDINNDKAEAEALDLSHSAPFIGDIKITFGDYKATEGSDIVIITAGAQPKYGETRLDVVQKSIKMYQDMIPKIVQYNKDAILLVVGNPVDILTYYTYKVSGFPKERVIGSGTVLDSSRFRYLLAKHMGVKYSEIQGMVIGEHGDSQVPLWSNVTAYGINVEEYACANNVCLTEEDKETIHKATVDGAFEVIRGKGYTNFAVASAIARIVKAIFEDENSVLPVGALYQGQYGIDDVYMAAPALVGWEGVRSIINVKLSEEEEEGLRKSAKALDDILRNEIKIKK